MKRKMSTADQSVEFIGHYSLRSRLRTTGVIDLTCLTPSPVATPVSSPVQSPVPTTSTHQDEAACSSTVPDLYTKLQNLEDKNDIIRNTEMAFCSVCDHFVDVNDGMLVRNCLHQICMDCIRKKIIDCVTIEVNCPAAACEYTLQDREIRALLSQAEYEFYMNKCAVVERGETLYKELLDLEHQGLIHNTEPFECKICFTEVDVYKGIMIRECLHQYCIDCIRSTINLSEDVQIKCPTIDCNGYIHDREIHALLTQAEFDKYSMKSLRVVESQAPNSYHCKKANCEGWCLVDDEVNTFNCPRCVSQNCLPCQAIHEGKNCKEYQDELRYAGLTDDQRSEVCLDDIVKNNLGMRCTTCKIVIMKREGCDYLICSMCKTDLCWATKQARWGPGGRGDTSGGCKCTPMKRCHPKCRNCH